VNKLYAAFDKKDILNKSVDEASYNLTVVELKNIKNDLLELNQRYRIALKRKEETHEAILEHTTRLVGSQSKIY
jgi:hypothetical protein